MDEQLRELIAEVCKYPSPSPEKQKALNRLLIQVQRLPGLAKSSHPDYLQALNRTWEWLSQNIQSFEPRPPSLQDSLVKWINGYLYWRIRDLYVPDKNTPSVHELVGGDEAGKSYLEQLTTAGLSSPTLTGIDGYIEQLQQQESQRIGLKVEQYIEDDPEQKLSQCHPKASPDCNCQLLSQRITLKSPPDKFSQLARELNINYQTLVQHWKRSCLPLLQTIAINLGYEPNQQP
ncbi:MAG TPA: hypothetical protein V6D33_11415 [Cyanophyceae cyanobacterium]